MSVFIPMDDANLALTDNWFLDGTPKGAATVCSNAYVKVAFAGTTTLSVVFDMSPFRAGSFDMSYCPFIYFQADSLPINLQTASVQLDPAAATFTVNINLDSALTTHYLTIFNNGRSFQTVTGTANMRWTPNSSGYPPMAVRILGFNVDNGGHTVSLLSTPIAVKSKRVRVYGDSKNDGGRNNGFNYLQFARCVDMGICSSDGL